MRLKARGGALNFRVGQAVADRGALQINLHGARDQVLVSLPDSVRHRRNIVPAVRLAEGVELEGEVLLVPLEELLQEIVLRPQQLRQRTEP